MHFSLVVPFYNEELIAENVVLDLLNAFRNRKVQFELVLVNNGSTDRTPQILKKLAKSNREISIVNIAENRGYGWGIISGLKAANGDYLGLSPGDGQVCGTEVVKVYRKLIDDGLDLCKAKQCVRDDGLIRKIQSTAYNFILPIFFKVQTRDINRSPKMIRRAVYELMHLSCEDWFLDAEIMIKSNRMALKVGEVPIYFEKRRTGKSNVKFTTVFEFIRNIIWYRLRNFD
jgi:glycosyltransferase involved in cell wall biosynthesis